jgi:rhodanese-related sulfurtransferase
MKLTQNKILAGSAVILSVFAVVAGNPYRSKNSYINPEQFADSLIAKKQYLTVVDLRNKKDYDDYHIPSAVNVNVAGIDPSNFDKRYMIVFYSGRDNISEAIQYKFEKEGFDKAYFLSGGIDDWMNKIIFPAPPKNFPAEEKKSFERIERRSMYFGGHPEREDKNFAKKVYRREGC